MVAGGAVVGDSVGFGRWPLSPDPLLHAATSTSSPAVTNLATDWER
jgi:hypothetical protein